MVGVQLAEGGLDHIVGKVGLHTNGDLVIGLVVGVARGGSCLERGLLVGGKRHRYTHEKSQTFKNKRHLFPLSSPAGVCATYPAILFSFPRFREPRLLEIPAPALRFSSALS